jgi:hypothetical protein
MSPNMNQTGVNPEAEDELGQFFAPRCHQCIRALGLAVAGEPADAYRPQIEYAYRRAVALLGPPAMASQKTDRNARAIYGVREFVRIQSIRNRQRIKGVRDSGDVARDVRIEIRDRLCDYLLARDDASPLVAFDPAAWCIRDHVRNEAESYLALHYAAFFIRRQNRVLRSMKSQSSAKAVVTPT